MNVYDFQKQLNYSWKDLFKKKKEDKKFIESDIATIKAHDIYFFSIDKNSLPGVSINISHNLNIGNFPKAKGWKVIGNKKKIEISVNNIIYIDFFIKLMNLILTKIYLKNLTEEKSVKCFLENLIFAKDFFEDDNAPRKLTKESQIGLYGEIHVLSKILAKKLNNKNLIDSWTGPSKKHDFTTEKILIEIKTTTTDSKKINTSSNNQIAPVFDKALNIIFLQIKNSSSGFSLVDVINNYLTILKTESEILHNDFLLKLAQCNYLDIHKDEYSQKYETDKTNYFEVRDDFPYIKKVEIPDELSDLTITYKIDLDKCEDFRINEEQLLAKI